MDQLGRRHQQARSYSIGGNDFHLNNGYSRHGKQVDYTQQNPYAEQYFSDRNTQPYQQVQGTCVDQRPTSSMSKHGRLSNYGDQSGRNNFQGAERQPKNQLHASLECLNTAYSDYGQHQNKYQPNNLMQQQQQQQQQQQPQSQFRQNQHYAASFVLTAAPAETVVNPHSDQDLAAAAMGSPPYSQRQHQQLYTTNGHSNMGQSHNAYLAQSLMNRNVVNASPMRRLGYNASTGMASITPTSLMNHLANASSTMRAGHSSLSLTSSTLLIEDKLHNEIKKLQSELKSEKEKNEALNSQLNINSNLMAAFEQSLTTLNSRLRHISALNDKKDQEIDELKQRLESATLMPTTCTYEQGTSPIGDLESSQHQANFCERKSRTVSPIRDLCVKSDPNREESELIKIIDDLKRQLIEKDRLLTDTRLEALSAAHQLEQLESKLNGEHSLLTNEDDLDEGVMVINHSPSDSEATTDTVHFSEANNQMVRATNNNKDVNQNASACNSSTGNDSYDEMREDQDKVQVQHFDLHNQSNFCSSDYISDEKSQDHTGTADCSRQKPSPDPFLGDNMNILFENVSMKN